MTSTIATLTRQTGVTVVSDWSDDVEIPVLTGVQRQGDVLVMPASVSAKTAVPSAGCPVVRGESGGNTHAIYADPNSGVCCDTRAPDVADLRVATLLVPTGATAWLAHPEHGFIGIGPGSYEIRRQREQADEMRMVAD